MGKYKFTKKEQQTLKVAKLNQDLSEAIKNDIDCKNEEWSECNNTHELFLKHIETQFEIVPEKHTYTEKVYQREISYVESVDWTTLVREVEEKYVSDVNFEELLDDEEIKRAYQHLREIDRAFEEKTGLCKKDIAFLTVAIGLQCVRQYVLDPWLKENRENSGPNDEKGEKKNAGPGWYYVPTENILINRVPFDAQDYNHTNDTTIKGFLKGAKDHRYVTLGHDPILGWFFGTANILTSTITRYDLESAHVKNNPISNKNYIHSKADNKKIIDALGKRWNEGFKDGKVAFALAVIKEAKHLLSDVKTKDSLPIPGIMMLSPNLAEKLAQYGIDVAGVTTEASMSVLINWIIAIVHKLCFDKEVDDEQFYEVRTRKIILYSNLIASTSNVLASCISKNAKILDVGGILVTISRLVSDVGFICKVKDEFVESMLDQHFEGIREEVEQLYQKLFSDTMN